MESARRAISRSPGLVPPPAGCMFATCCRSAHPEIISNVLSSSSMVPQDTRVWISNQGNKRHFDTQQELHTCGWSPKWAILRVTSLDPRWGLHTSAWIPHLATHRRLDPQPGLLRCLESQTGVPASCQQAAPRDPVSLDAHSLATPQLQSVQAVSMFHRCHKADLLQISLCL